MIAFFPEPYADELAYSLFARYHVHSGNMTFSGTAKDLFQCKDAIPNPEFFVPLSEEVCNIITRNPEPVKRGKIYEYDQEKADLVLAMAEIKNRAERALPPPKSCHAIPKRSFPPSFCPSP